MKFYGNTDHQKNKVINPTLIIANEAAFPTNPSVGEVLFKDKVLYICVDLGSGLPVWVPLTQTINAYNFTQSTPATTWTINHNLKTGFPLVTVYDNNGYQVIPDNIQITSQNQVVVTFGVAVTGKAVVIVGDMEGGARPEYAYEHIQSNPSTTWTINHGLNKYPIVRVFIGNLEVQPLEIEHVSMNETVIRFTDPQVGIARLV